MNGNDKKYTQTFSPLVDEWKLDDCGRPVVVGQYNVNELVASEYNDTLTQILNHSLDDLYGYDIENNSEGNFDGSIEHLVDLCDELEQIRDMYKISDDISFSELIEKIKIKGDLKNEESEKDIEKAKSKDVQKTSEENT